MPKAISPKPSSKRRPYKSAMTPKIGESTIAGAVNNVMIHESWASVMPKGWLSAGKAG